MKHNPQWEQQSIFRKRVEDYCRKNRLLTTRGAVKMGEVADLFNLNEVTLRQFLQDCTRKRPHINTLTHIANVIGCSVTEFIDAPNTPSPGISKQGWSQLSPQERTLATKLLSAIASDQLTVLEKEELCKIFHTAEKALVRVKKK